MGDTDATSMIVDLEGGAPPSKPPGVSEIDKDGRFWYWKLNGETGLFNSNPREFAKKGNLIAVDVPGKEGIIKNFALFDNIEEFFKFQFSCKDFKKHFYECIFGDMFQKPYLDIDIDCDNFPNLDCNDIETWSKYLIELLIEQLEAELSEFGHEKPHIIVYASHGDKKKSYHIVVMNYYTTNYIQTREFVKCVINRMYDVIKRTCDDEKSVCWCDFIKKCIDMSVYKSFQQLRILGSHKLRSFDQKRTKVIHGYQTDTTAYDLESFEISFVSNVNDDSILIEYDLGPDVIDKTKYSNVKIDNDIIDNIVKYVNNKLDSNLTIRSVDGNRVDLTNNGGYECLQCERPHENDNPFLLVFENAVLFYCRRKQKLNSDKLQGLQILRGNMGIIPNIDEEGPILEALSHREEAPRFGDEILTKNGEFVSIENEETHLPGTYTEIGTRWVPIPPDGTKIVSRPAFNPDDIIPPISGKKKKFKAKNNYDDNRKIFVAPMKGDVERYESRVIKLKEYDFSDYKYENIDYYLSNFDDFNFLTETFVKYNVRKLVRVGKAEFAFYRDQFALWEFIHEDELKPVIYDFFTQLNIYLNDLISPVIMNSRDEMFIEKLNRMKDDMRNITRLMKKPIFPSNVYGFLIGRLVIDTDFKEKFNMVEELIAIPGRKVLNLTNLKVEERKLEHYFTKEVSVEYDEKINTEVVEKFLKELWSTFDEVPMLDDNGKEQYVEEIHVNDRTGEETVIQTDKIKMRLVLNEEKSKEKYEYMLRAKGSGLTGRTCDDKIHICVNKGNNGKSLLAKAEERMLGDNTTGKGFYQPTDPSVLVENGEKATQGARPFMMVMKGARMCVLTDTGKNSSLSSGAVKSIGDKMISRKLRENPESFYFMGSVFVLTNSITGDYKDPALQKRIVVFPYEMTFYEIDDVYYKEGIINFGAVENFPGNLKPGNRKMEKFVLTPDFQKALFKLYAIGASEYLNNGLRVPDFLRLKFTEYFYKADDLTSFFEDENYEFKTCKNDKNNCAFGKKNTQYCQKHRTPHGYFKTIYSTWYRKEFNKDIKYKPSDIKDRLKKMGYESYKGSDTHYFRGFSMRDPDYKID
jgi:hypothetical protein